MFNIQNIKAADVLEVESALRSIVRSRYPEVTAEQGSVLDDLVIKSLGYLATAIKSEANLISRKLYLADLEVSSDPDSYQLLEDIAANFLVFNSEAPPRRGVVTFRFTTDILRIIPADITLSRGDNFILVKLFDSSQDITVTPDSYITVTIGDTTYYEYSVLAESVRQDSGVAIPAGTFNSSAAMIDLESVLCYSPFVGVDETSFSRLSLSEKLQYALQSRNFSTYNGIQATILNEGIPNLVRVLGVGSQDKEMSRDVIPSTLSASVFHSLGMANVVLVSKLSSEVIPITEGQASLGNRPIVGFISARRNSIDVPLVADFDSIRYIKRFEGSTSITTIEVESIEAGQELAEGTASILVDDEDHKLVNGSSDSTKFSIYVPSGESNLTALVASVDNNIPTVQGLIDSDVYNTLASSIVAMSGVRVQIIIPDLVIRLDRNLATTSLNINLVKSALRSYVEEWSNDYALSVSGLAAHLSLIFSGLVTSVLFKGGIRYIAYLPDGRFIGFSSTSELSVEQDELQLYPSGIPYQTSILPLQVSDRVLNYTLASEDIAIEVTNV